MNSQLYLGWVRHRRYLPKAHAFRYPVFMTWLDLDEITAVFSLSRLWSIGRFNWVSFWRADYLGSPVQDLKAALVDRLQAETGSDFVGRICLLTHLRFLGYGFNPVSFYFCYPEGSEQPRYIIAEITNTPWDERFAYVLDTQQSASQGRHWRFDFPKAFHVSPFMPMDLDYCWQFSLRDEHLTIHMQLFKSHICQFDATLQLKAEALTPKSMTRIPLRFPFMTLKVVLGIYWQALRLWLKGIPFFSHPQPKRG